jgi:hypothetical protein
MINELELMEQFAYDNDIKLLTDSLPGNISGFCYSNSEFTLKTITLNSNLVTTAEKTCVLAEEIEHYITTPFDLFAAPKHLQDKFERLARFNATKRLIPFDKLIEARRMNIRCPYELADFLNITIDFLFQGTSLFREHYNGHVIHKGFRINFSPFFIEPTISA